MSERCAGMQRRADGVGDCVAGKSSAGNVDAGVIRSCVTLHPKQHTAHRSHH